MIPLTPTTHALAKAYERHHWRCPACISAGMRYGQRCPAGLKLWRAYQAAI